MRHKAEFVLASIGLTAGWGMSGDFLLFFMMMVTEGIPLFHIRSAVGQRFLRSAIVCWKKMHPALMRVGISCVVISLRLCNYHVSVTAWCFHYFFLSFTSKLPRRLQNCPKYDIHQNVTAECAASKVNQTIKANFTPAACNLTKTFPDCCLYDPQF